MAKAPQPSLGGEKSVPLRRGCTSSPHYNSQRFPGSPPGPAPCLLASATRDVTGSCRCRLARRRSEVKSSPRPEVCLHVETMCLSRGGGPGGEGGETEIKRLQGSWLKKREAGRRCT